MAADVGRVVALGASNLTRGFHTVVSAARSVWGHNIEVLAALGHGRSYGSPSILKSGLWSELNRRAPMTTRALVTDVGNDILYGFSVERTLGWVEEVLIRLRRITQDIVLTDLPMTSVRRLSEVKFVALRSMLVPSCRLTLSQVLDRAERVNEGLEQLSEEYGTMFFRLHPSWYGFDPIHMTPSQWRPAWEQILGAQSLPGTSAGLMLEGMTLYLMRPERRWIFGKEQVTLQAGRALRFGGQVWLY